MNRSIGTGRWALCLLASLCGAGTACGWEAPVDELERARTLVERAAERNHVSTTTIRARVLELQEEQRACMRTHANQTLCREQMEKGSRARGFSVEELALLQAAAVRLGWERACLKQRLRLSDADARRLFGAVFAAHRSCASRPPSVRQSCEDAAVLARCTNEGLRAADCGLLLSVGIDSGWSAPGDDYQRLRPESFEAEKREQKSR